MEKKEIITGMLLVLISKGVLKPSPWKMDKEQPQFWIYLRTFSALKTKLLLYFVLFLRIFQ